MDLKKEQTITLSDDVETITLDLSSINAALEPGWVHVTSGTSMIGSDVIHTGTNQTWTTNTGTWSISPDALNGTTIPTPTISLTGEDADIEINGVSLMETLRGIQDHLNILRPDPEMEKEWDELKSLRDQYESKLTEFREKSRAWKALQQRG